ncbi:hypothetical protein OC25_09950 [Pedobacter kyungheensis]|uniref:Ricin B lectin domain-containing protein n=2 Tax=Pedobacter kyungheensis TaxID=1069985 RepID=A0A0C1DJS8_9SPHI|nr:hypothetical protein OC25_09950 [Pedobacter kyungheensis]
MAIYMRPLLMFIFLILSVASQSHAQALPPLVHQLNLDDGSAYDATTGQTGTVSGTLVGAFDRFGIQNGATFFQSSNQTNQGTGIKLSKSTSYPDAYNTKFTVSVWVYCDLADSIPSGPVPFPTGSIYEQIFNLHDQNRVLNYNGIAKNWATLGLDRYIKNTAGVYSNWYLWNYEPIQFDQRGWYHIITTASQYFTRIYMYKPDGNMVCGMTYMGTQSIDNNFIVTLGAYSMEGGSAIAYMDDFKMYSDTVSKAQVQQIHNNDLVPPGSSPRPVTGKIYRIKNVNSGLYLSLTDFNWTDDNDAVQRPERYAGSSCLWQVIPLSSGNVRIKNVFNGKLLALASYSTDNGIRVSVWERESPTTPDARWHLIDAPNGSFRLQNAYSGKFAVVKDALPTEWANIIQYDSGEENSQWIFEEVSLPDFSEDKDFFIVNKRSGLTTTLTSYGLSNGTGINQNSDGYAGATQVWKLKKDDKGLYQMISKLTDKQLQVNDASFDNGALITQWDQGDYIQGKWRIFEPSYSNSSNRCYYIANANSGKIMVITGGSTTSGDPIFQWSGEDGMNGAWSFQESNTTPVLAPGKVYRIVNRNSGQYLSLSDFNNDNNTAAKQNIEAFSGAGHLFKLIKDGEGRYDIVNFYTGKSLQLDNSVANLSADEVGLRQKKQQQNDYQKWIISELRSTPGYFHISNALTGKPIVVQNASSAYGAQVFQYWENGPNGDWQFQEVDITPKVNGQVLTQAGFSNKHSGMFLDLSPRNSTNGAAAVQILELEVFGWNLWNLNRQADGKYQLFNSMTNKLLAVEFSSLDNGAVIWQWQANQTAANGRWIIFQAAAPNQDYWRIANENSGKYAIVNNSTSSSSAVVQWNYGGADGALWVPHVATPSSSNTSALSMKNSLSVPNNPDTHQLEASTLVSPNGDGNNDKFIIKNIEYYPNNSIKIFDKVGRVLYSKKRYANDWDASINGSLLSEGTYYYVIDPGDGSPTIKGFINVIRN